jgi:hypothetical protein
LSNRACFEQELMGFVKDAIAAWEEEHLSALGDTDEGPELEGEPRNTATPKSTEEWDANASNLPPENANATDEQLTHFAATSESNFSGSQEDSHAEPQNLTLQRTAPHASEAIAVSGSTVKLEKENTSEAIPPTQVDLVSAVLVQVEDDESLTPSGLPLQPTVVRVEEKRAVISSTAALEKVEVIEAPLSQLHPHSDDFVYADRTSEDESDDIEERRSSGDTSSEHHAPRQYDDAPLNSSLDVSDSEHLCGDDAYHSGDVSMVRVGRSTMGGDAEYGTAGSDHDEEFSEVFALSHGPGVAPARQKELSLPICAVVGAESLLGSHVVQSLLNARTHRVRALVASAESAELLSRMQHASELLSVSEIGRLDQSSSQVPLRGSLRGVETVVNCSDTISLDVRLSRVADAMLAAARNLADAVGAAGSTVNRVVHCGSDLACWDPRTSQSSTLAIEPDLDENDWFSIMDNDRKVSHAEAYGWTAAEMLLWARAAGDRVPYTLCSVVSSLLLGPLCSPSQSSAPGPRVS